jgi:hypothetical protein
MNLDSNNWGQWIANDGVSLPEKGLIVWAVSLNPIGPKVKVKELYELGPDYVVARVHSYGKSWLKMPESNPIIKYRIYKSKGFKQVEDLMKAPNILLLEDKTKNELV